MRSKAAVAILLLALSGCALISQGTTQRIKFESAPPKAEIWLNGQMHPELTPTTIELPRAEVSYQIKKQGFDTVASKLTCRTSSYFYWSLLMGLLAGGVDWITGAWQEFDLPEEAKETIKVNLEPSIDNSDHIIAISSNPPGASIKIGNIDLPEKSGVKGRGTRVNVKWQGPADQERIIELKLINHVPAQVLLRRGEKGVHKDLDTLPISQSLVFESDPPGAEVLFNGVPLKSKTPFSNIFEWPRGDDRERTVDFRLAGYRSERQILKDKISKTIRVTLTEIVDTVAVRIDCTPPGSDLEVDGSARGRLPADIKLDWSVSKKSYKLKVSRPGYESQELVIDAAKRSEPVSLRLKPALPDFP